MQYCNALLLKLTFPNTDNNNNCSSNNNNINNNNHIYCVFYVCVCFCVWVMLYYLCDVQFLNLFVHFAFIYFLTASFIFIISNITSNSIVVIFV